MLLQPHASAPVGPVDCFRPCYPPVRIIDEKNATSVPGQGPLVTPGQMSSKQCFPVNTPSNIATDSCFKETFPQLHVSAPIGPFDGPGQNTKRDFDFVFTNTEIFHLSDPVIRDDVTSLITRDSQPEAPHLIKESHSDLTLLKPPPSAPFLPPVGFRHFSQLIDDHAVRNDTLFPDSDTPVIHCPASLTADTPIDTATSDDDGHLSSLVHISDGLERVPSPTPSCSREGLTAVVSITQPVHVSDPTSSQCQQTIAPRVDTEFAKNSRAGSPQLMTDGLCLPVHVTNGLIPDDPLGPRSHASSGPLKTGFYGPPSYGFRSSSRDCAVELIEHSSFHDDGFCVCVGLCTCVNTISNLDDLHSQTLSSNCFVNPVCDPNDNVPSMKDCSPQPALSMPVWNDDLFGADVMTGQITAVTSCSNIGRDTAEDQTLIISNTESASIHEHETGNISRPITPPVTSIGHIASHPTSRTAPPMSSSVAAVRISTRGIPSQCPPNTCRIGQHLAILAPTPVHVFCTEGKCDAVFRVTSLQRYGMELREHLFREHRIEILNTSIWCCICHWRQRRDIKTHSCFRKHGMILPTSMTLSSAKSGTQHCLFCTQPSSSQPMISTSNELSRGHMELTTNTTPMASTKVPSPLPVDDQSGVTTTPPAGPSGKTLTPRKKRSFRRWRSERSGRPDISSSSESGSSNPASPNLSPDGPAPVALASSSSSGVPGSSHTPSYADVVSSPQLYRPASQSILSVIDAPPPRILVTSRAGDVLNIVFPIEGQLHCTERNCSATFKSDLWTSMKRSLGRHLDRDHRISLSCIKHWCSVCGNGMGDRPSKHTCLSSLITPVMRSFAYPCPDCSFVATHPTGLRNHCAKHTRAKHSAQFAKVQLPRPDAFRRGTMPGAPPRSTGPTITRPEQEIRLSQIPLPDGTPPPPAQPGMRLTPSPDAAVPFPGTPPTAIQNRSADTLIVESTPVDIPTPTQSSNGQPSGMPDSQSQISLTHYDTGGSVAPGPDDMAPMTLNGDPIDEDSSPLHAFVEPLRDILDGPLDQEDWTLFEGHLDDISAEVAKIVKLPEITDNGVFTPRDIDPLDPAQIQKLYRRNRKRAVRLITDGQSTRCDIQAPEVENFFSEVCAPKTLDASLYDSVVCSPNTIDMTPFSARDVSNKLKAFENSAPGSDRITYMHWRSADPECRVLTPILNICLAARRVPAKWKAARSILLHKSGDKNDIHNWRPITLSVTIFKLLAGCIAKRMSAWISENQILSPCQKGFLPADGVFEHNYVLNRRIQKTRTTRSDLCIGSLDFSNAFGSIPHQAISVALNASGASPAFTDLIKDIYTGATTHFPTPEGCTANIPILAGVRQGCPLSGLLFNVCIDPIIRAVDEDSRIHGALCYADDILLLAESPESLQGKIDTVHLMAKKISVELNSNKCFSCHISGRPPVGTRPTNFNIAGQNIKSLGDGEQGMFLGKPIGFMVPHSLMSLKDLLDTARKLTQSKLAPWQIIDSLKSFFFPSLHFMMRTNQLNKGEWAKIDGFLRPAVKRILNLPAEACNAYLYGTAKNGTCALPLAAEDADIAIIDGAFKLLSSSDELVCDLAWEDLTEGVTARLQQPATDADLVDFLSGCNDQRFRRSSNRISNAWTAARMAAGRNGITWMITGNRNISLIHPGGTIAAFQRRQVCRRIRNHRRQTRTEELIALRDQGKVMECVAASRASSHFIRDGGFTRFADWRFIHRARLNLVPLNGCKRWGTNNDTRCRRCGDRSETLPHVLNHCRPFLHLTKKRHDAIVERVKKAALGRFSILSEDREVGVPGLRPDLVLTKGSSAVIVDITVPFDNRIQAFARAREEKLRKYAPVVEKLKESYRDVSVDAFIVGSLGSWDNGNEPLLKRICSKRYASLMRKLCVSDSIRWSRDIYVQFLNEQRHATSDTQSHPPPDFDGHGHDIDENMMSDTGAGGLRPLAGGASHSVIHPDNVAPTTILTNET